MSWGATKLSSCLNICRKFEYQTDEISYMVDRMILLRQSQLTAVFVIEYNVIDVKMNKSCKTKTRLSNALAATRNEHAHWPAFMFMTIHHFTVSYRYWQLTGNKYKVSWHTQQSKYNQIDENPYCVQFIDFHLCSSSQSRQSEIFCKIGLKNKIMYEVLEKKTCKESGHWWQNGDTKKGICILTIE